jgi:hypothetical protein
VLSRLAQITERTAAIAAAASLTAGCGDSHTGDGGGSGNGGNGAGSGGNNGGTGGISAGTGGSSAGSGGMNVSGSGGSSGAGTGGAAGYWVVDPMPPPFLCPAPDALAVSMVTATWNTWGIQLDLVVGDGTMNTFLTGVTTEMGVDVTTVSRVNPIMLQVSATPWPEGVDVYLDFTCSGQNGTLTYQVGIRLDTQMPVSSGSVPYELITDDADGGV